jgi:hypothetical protein
MQEATRASRVRERAQLDSFMRTDRVQNQSKWNIEEVNYWEIHG